MLSYLFPFLEDNLIGKKEFSYEIVVVNWQAGIVAAKSSGGRRIKNWPGEGGPGQSAKYWKVYAVDNLESI
jgi:hypothetical protein